MKFSKWILGAALLFSTQVGNVQAGSCDPCDPCATSCDSCDFCDIDFCDLEYTGYVDFLYWQVCRGDLDFDDEDGYDYINPGYDAGWRIGGIASYKCWDFGFRYTSFYSSDSKNDTHYSFDFDNLDLEVGYTCCLDCINGSVRPFAGAKLVWIDEKLKYNNDFEAKNEFNGYGLYLGLEGRVQLCEFCACDREIPIALVTRASTGILHSKFCYDSDDTDYKDECLYVNVHELYAGLELTFCDVCDCYDTFVQLGYEVQKYGDWREFDESDDMSSLGFGGLVLRFGASF